MRVIIVGGVAGGATAAARLRRLDEKAEIVIYERGKHISFANCGIPYFCGDVISDGSRLLVMTPDKFRKLLAVEAKVEHEVVSIDRANKRVVVRERERGREFTDNYDVLILSPGASPVRPPVPGIGDPRIVTVRTIEDGVRIRQMIKPGQTALVVGGGFIGLEMAENLAHARLQVTVVELSEQVMAPLDPEMAAQVHNHLRDKGIGLILGDGVRSFADNGGKLTVNLNSGACLSADLVVLAIGVRPDSDLAVQAGLEVNQRRAIVVDRQLRTSDPNVYAIGDAVQVVDRIAGRAVMIPLAGPANRQGRLAADVIMGAAGQYCGTLGTAVAKVFDLTVASTGFNEKQLKGEEGWDYGVVYSRDWSHAEYYPQPLPMVAKLLYRRSDGLVLGAQIVGYSGVDKRIDTIASAIAMSATTADLVNLELAYAPPYGSAKDPVNIWGMIAENIRDNRVKPLLFSQLLDRPQDYMVVDVRTAAEFALGSVEGAVNIPVEELRQRLDDLPKNRPVALLCDKGKKGYFASRILLQRGFENVYNVVGGLTLIKSVLRDRKERGQPLGVPAEARTLPAADNPDRGRSRGTAIKIDACGLQCPGPILRLAESLDKLAPGEQLTITTTDPGFRADVSAWCASTGNCLVSLVEKEGVISAVVAKGGNTPTGGTDGRPAAHGKTIVVFSNDLDKVMAAFIIATGAAATGKPVTMFFTFWGLSVLRRPGVSAGGKGWLEKMFGWMLPGSCRQLALSKMHFAGVGTAMMKTVMRQKKVSSLPELIEQARLAGVRLVVCQMSMEVMGLKAEELIDGVEVGGVASYIAAAEQSDLNLFI
ncbi:MAG: FAD-dependent oxidoreductase [Negativicutes bacterium]|nr:FAD-dependent oxidoreductase [Negativicutes bacterium]